MNVNTNSKIFASLFTKFRLKAEFATLGEFGKALADEGLLYEDSIFSRWQQGNRIPKDRRLLLTIIKVFVKKRGIISIEEANLFLEAAGHGYLTALEEKELFPEDLLQKTRRLDRAGDEFDAVVSSISESVDKLWAIEKQIKRLYEKIYEGYPSLAYDQLNKLASLIYALDLNKNEKGRDLLTRISWIKLRCFIDLADIKAFPSALAEADSAISFARENNTSEIGTVYWMKSALLRLNIIMDSSKLSHEKAVESLQIAELAVKNMHKNQTSELLHAHMEVAKIALLLKDTKLYNSEIEKTFGFLGKLTPELSYIGATVWDVKARGHLRFGLEVDKALDSLHIAKTFSNIQYQAINLYLHNTQLQALRESKDPEYKKYAKKLEEKTLLEASLLGNPYQTMRSDKKFTGL